MTTGLEETFLKWNVNGTFDSPAFAWRTSDTVSHARIFGAMLSPESAGFGTCTGAGCGWAASTGGEVLGVTDCGFFSEVLHPTKEASNRNAIAPAKFLTFTENIPSLLSHRLVTNKFQIGMVWNC